MIILFITKLEHFFQEEVTCGDLQKQRIAELNRAVNISMEQLRQNQAVDGPTSRENMKRKIDMLVKAKNDN